MICTAFVVYIAMSFSVTFGICGDPSEFKRIGLGSLFGLEGFFFGRVSTSPDTYMCQIDCRNNIASYPIYISSSHIAAIPERLERPSIQGKRK